LGLKNLWQYSSPIAGYGFIMSPNKIRAYSM
jgi:hypothetical protein